MDFKLWYVTEEFIRHETGRSEVWELEREIDELTESLKAAQERIASLTEPFQHVESCGHASNFLMGDEHGHFSCQICRAESAERERDALQAGVDAVNKYRGHFVDWLRDLMNAAIEEARKEHTPQS